MIQLVKDAIHNPERYRKGYTVLAGAVLEIVGRHLGVDSSWYLDLVALGTAAGVIGIPNVPAPSAPAKP